MIYIASYCFTYTKYCLDYGNEYILQIILGELV